MGRFIFVYSWQTRCRNCGWRQFKYVLCFYWCTLKTSSFEQHRRGRVYSSVWEFKIWFMFSEFIESERSSCSSDVICIYYECRFEYLEIADKGHGTMQFNTPTLKLKVMLFIFGYLSFVSIICDTFLKFIYIFWIINAIFFEYLWGYCGHVWCFCKSV